MVTKRKVYYKATRPDGTDFRTGTVLYQVGERTTHASEYKWKNEPSSYLSVATVETDCTGMRWPCRLFAVHGVGRGLTADNLPNKRGFSAVDVVEELDAWRVFGPQSEQVVWIIERCKTLTVDEGRRLVAAWAATRGAAWAATRGAAWGAARDAAWAATRAAIWDATWDATWAATWAAALALLTKDLITTEQFDLLYNPWLSVIGEPVCN